ncbi:MAG TPA: FtsW/RodA/SpoVE family cell cycle protein [Acidimicrobiales bacterium]|nr:FtsW/RodA/SpoVE family cell cycle protein [Acidimicrobiales bacterium]
MPSRDERRPEPTRSRGLWHPLPRGNALGRMLIAVTMALVIFGTIFVASASEGQSGANGGTAFSIMIHDIAYLCLGIFALYLGTRVRLERLVKSAPLIVGSGLVLLLAVKAVGVTTNGGKRWLNLRVIDLQPSELFKLCVVLFVAWLVLHHHDELNNWKQLLVWTMPIWIGCAFIVLEPDIGTATVVLVIAVAMLAVAGLSRQLIGGVLVLAVVSVGGYLLVEPYSAKRFFSFLHPNANVLGSGYQLLQSKIGLGAGGVTGLGLGHSREKWGLLPNPHTDFIFTIVGEELGVVGTLAVIALFIAFLMVAVRIAQRCSNQVYRLIAVGITTWIVVEALINIASVVGWWAVTGVPLPFFSYGGTALITELAAIGVLYNIAHDQTRTGDLTIQEHRVTNFRAALERPRVSAARTARRPEARRPEARRPEPRRAEPRRADPRRADPRRADPRRVDPARADRRGAPRRPREY